MSSTDALFSASLRDVDPEIAHVIGQELGRQRDEIELIASENIVSRRPCSRRRARCLTNKYAEGLPGKRYYGGCQYVDIAEQLAIDRVTKLFGCQFANVQPHSGASANAAVFFALMQPGDTFMGLNLAAGGHLSHGMAINMSGKWFKPVPYNVRRDDQRIDMDEVLKLAKEHKPKVIIAGGSAYPRIIDFKRFREIGDEVGALLMVDMAHFAGLVAGGAHPSPFPHAHVVTTTTHKTLRGPRGGFILTNDEELAKKINSAVFPGMQGGPLMHVIAAKAVAFGEALQPSFKIYAKNVVENAKALAETLKVARPRYRFRRHRHASDAGRSAAEAPDRQGRRTGARPRAHHLQQERHPVRSGKADGHVGHPARHAGRHHARLRRRGVQAGRRDDRRSARRAVAEGRRRRHAGRSGGAREGEDVARTFSDLSVIVMPACAGHPRLAF